MTVPAASPGGARCPVQRGVEGDRGVDQCQVREGLGEVADLLAGQGDLLGVQTDVVGVESRIAAGVGLGGKLANEACQSAQLSS